MSAVIKCWGPVHAVKETVSGEYLKSFDPEAHDGRGEALFTPNKEEALVFTSAVEAIKCWQQQSEIRPYRDDGKKNRPLTAFSASFENI